MNSKSYFVALLAACVVLLALIARNGSVSILAMPLLIYLLVGILKCPLEMTLSTRREFDRVQAIAGEPIEARIVIENRGKGLANLLVSDAIPPGITIIEGRPQYRSSLASGQTMRLEYRAAGVRGVHVFQTVSASASDPLGLFQIRREFPILGEILFRPASMKLHDVRMRPRSTLHAPGPILARLAGTGTDFWGVREYRPGDPLHRLNWRLAGRHPRRLFTNEYEGEEIGDFGFILDARRRGSSRQIEDTLFESSVSAAASLSEHLLKKGNRVSLLTFGEKTGVLFPGYGKRQINLVSRQLASASLGRDMPFRYLEYFLARVFPLRSVIVAFSLLDGRDLETYARLRSYGYDVLLISPNPIASIRQALPRNTVNDLAVRAVRLERVLQLERLLKLGVGVIDWHVNEPLDFLLQRTITATAHRRNL